MVVEEAEAAALAAAAPMRRSTSCGTRCDIRVPEVPHVASRGCLISPRAQEVIALHDKDRGTRMKITEPKTPYHAPSTGSSGVGGTRRRAWLAYLPRATPDICAWACFVCAHESRLHHMGRARSAPRLRA